MKKKKDFYLEYIETVEELLHLFINRCQHISKAAINLEKLDFSKTIINTLWTHIFFSYRDEYNNERLKRNTKKNLKRLIWDKDLKPLLPNSNETGYIETVPSKAITDMDYLEEYNGAVCFYCYNLRQLYYFLPLLQRIQETTVIFYNFDLGNFNIDNQHIIFIEFSLRSDFQCFYQSFLQRNFPYLFWFTNNFMGYLSALQPKCIVLLEGCHSEMEALSLIGQQIQIQTLCLQQGWPSVMHSRFRNMTYDYFLTWGNIFNGLWKKYNSDPKFVSIGYCYKVPKVAKENIITFFLQAPVIILNEQYFEKILEFTLWCAESFPKYKVWVREHPEFAIDQSWINKFSLFPNIEIKSSGDLSSIFSLTKIGVSSFSSTLMEGLVHNVIPIILELSSVPYYPQDIKGKKLGYIAKTIEQAKLEMCSILENQSVYEENFNIIRNEKQGYFFTTGDNAVNNTLDFLKKLNY
ncbi:hypothetical protein [Sphingobacterium sp.]|uniref:hypothetical protein n=1 Tax=Sphingobacterium sp. TaxID=341027 RepID=UPI002897865F|nr:hypothetical protein [Sphingobacterium sp.]